MARIRGTSRDDLLLIGSVAADSILGFAGADVLNALGGNDLLDGGPGADMMKGGAGDDRYFVDNVGDRVIEMPGQGRDTIVSSVSRVLSANVEVLILSGPAALNGTGNAGPNHLAGTSAANILNGLGGADTMAGGGGSDRYYVDNPLDRITETLSGGTADSVYSRIDFTLPANVENLVLLGGGGTSASGNALPNQLTGNSGGNTLAGLDGEDSIYGGAGDDALFGGAGDDMLHGQQGQDILRGGDGNDLLDGGTGDDDFEGGTGDDIYFVDSPLDFVRELDGEGHDTLITGITWWLLPNGVESLILAGTADIDGFGNAEDNTITGNSGANHLSGAGYPGGPGGQDTLIGHAGNDTYAIDDTGDTVIEQPGEGDDTVISTMPFYALGANVENLVLGNLHSVLSGDGNELSNTIHGNEFDNVLRGLAGNDVIHGEFGADTLVGGPGDDEYFDFDGLNTFIEEADEGTDTIHSVAPIVLPDNVENLVLAMDYDTNGTGNSLPNAITGNSGRNRLDGAGGADVLSGMDGDDTLVYDVMDNHLDGGSGHDTLAVAGAGVILDLSVAAGERITGIERIDLGGADNGSITLDALGLLGLSATSNQLWVDGAADDTVTLLGPGWQQAPGGPVVVGDQSYLTYVAGNARLIVDADVTVVPT